MFLWSMQKCWIMADFLSRSSAIAAEEDSRCVMRSSNCHLCCWSSVTRLTRDTVSSATMPGGGEPYMEEHRILREHYILRTSYIEKEEKRKEHHILSREHHLLNRKDHHILDREISYIEQRRTSYYIEIHINNTGGSPYVRTTVYFHLSSSSINLSNLFLQLPSAKGAYHYYRIITAVSCKCSLYIYSVQAIYI